MKLAAFTDAIGSSIRDPRLNVKLLKGYEMPKTQKTVWKIKDTAGKYLDCKGWEAEHEKSSCICYAPLYKNGKVVALIVASGDYDSAKDDMAINAEEIIAALSRAAQEPA